MLKTNFLKGSVFTEAFVARVKDEVSVGGKSTGTSGVVAKQYGNRRTKCRHDSLG